ncbi:MAG TPA: type II toxin-antitoxin system HipA family toxin [Solirubrobacterales bacterium]|nr:type II toxin-antitoxin system HipA family toxin [Solirubrobacterales bacterium]
MNELVVYLHGVEVGTLERLPQARLRFAYATEYVEAESAPVSLSLPLREEPFEDDECGPFFQGLLPEGDFLRAVARVFHVSADNPFAVLAAIGGECAGAISLGPTEGPAPGTVTHPPRWLDETELRQLLADLPERPLALLDDAEDDEGIRISLAGAHDKIGVLCEGQQIGLTRGAPPSTHILKMPIARVSEPIVDEAYCMALAASIGLDVAVAEPWEVGGHEFLLARRYDRDPETLPDTRLHQEDFCQALGVAPAEKYEGDGGPGVATCAALVWRVSSAPARDVTALADALLFNFLIANHDAHAKNYSLLLDGPEAIRLAPLYDLLCTAVFTDTRKKLAMKYGGENRPEYLRRRHLDRLADALNVKGTLVRRRAARMIELVGESAEAARASLPVGFQDRPLLAEIEALIEQRRRRLAKALTEPS